jgi:hypothetical protein
VSAKAELKCFQRDRTRDEDPITSSSFQSCRNSVMLKVVMIGGTPFLHPVYNRTCSDCLGKS